MIRVFLDQVVEMDLQVMQVLQEKLVAQDCLVILDLHRYSRQDQRVILVLGDHQEKKEIKGLRGFLVSLAYQVVQVTKENLENQDPLVSMVSKDRKENLGLLDFLGQRVIQEDLVVLASQGFLDRKVNLAYLVYQAWMVNQDSRVMLAYQVCLAVRDLLVLQEQLEAVAGMVFLVYQVRKEKEEPTVFQGQMDLEENLVYQDVQDSLEMLANPDYLV